MNDPSNLFSLSGKTALITGSSRGIGEAIARGFAAAGAKVWVHGLEIEKGRTIADEIGGQFVAADLTQPASIHHLVEQITQEETAVDILVNNAGIEIIAPFEALDLAVLDRTLQVNLRAVVSLTQGLLPLLTASSAASIINMTSIHQRIPYRSNAAYAMSKAALEMLSKTLALELAPHNIRVNNLAPGAVETEINREVIEQIGHEQFAEWIPLGRVAQTSEIIGPALFSASEASSYMTGTTLYVDGGYMQNLVRYQPSE